MKGALFHHYDWHFHKMIGRLRRLDGTYKVPDGKKAIDRGFDPMAADRLPKFYIAGSAAPMYGHFFYLFMDNVMAVALKPLLGKALFVGSERALDVVLKARFGM